jgi:hypothetical protein
LHINDATGVSRIRLSGGAANADNFDIGQSIPGVSNSGFSIYDVDATASRLVIDSTGNVGIGTTGPSANLHVYGGASSNTLPSNAQAIFEYSANGGIAISVPAANTAGLYFPRSTDSYYAGIERNGTDLTFRNNGSTKATIDSSGRLLVGTSSARSNVYYTTVATTPSVQFESVGSVYNGLSLINYSASGFSPVLTLGLSASNTQGTNTAIASTHDLGAINFAGNDGTNFRTGASIIATNDQASAWAVGDCPTRLVFSTTADGASSPTERMRIDNAGNVGIGATPVAWGGNFKALQIAPWTSLLANNNNGAVSLTCNAYYAGSGGGTLTYIGTGPATNYTQLPGSHFWSIAASGTAGTAITFTDAMTLDSSGRWYVGTSTDGGAGGFTIYPAGSGAGSAAIGVWNKTNTAAESAAQFRVSATTVGSITYSNVLVAYNTTSDYRLKENVTSIPDGIARCKQLKPSRFNFKVDPDHTVEGFIAHEAQAVVPECVTGEKDAVDEDGNPKYQGIDQSKLVPLLTAALQEAIAKIEALETRLSALEAA